MVSIYNEAHPKKMGECARLRVARTTAMPLKPTSAAALIINIKVAKSPGAVTKWDPLLAN
ncbi:MAG TPA: hypothetical protein VEF35_08535 [Candidatus Bathyarchaeia archaeon]|nr:hypothetical protein [Candidatus Bathyarchaeia archaeon]